MMAQMQLKVSSFRIATTRPPFRLLRFENVQLDVLDGIYSKIIVLLRHKHTQIAIVIINYIRFVANKIPQRPMIPEQV